MEIREFATNLLYSENLEDKLFAPDILTDNQPGISVKLPNFPGRPSNLKFCDPHKQKTPFPSIAHIENLTTRGQILHFFANHELLALELMALTLLRFPDAPKNFRMGIVNTIIEEQRHMSLYTERMNEFSVGFGEVPVSSFFWDSLKNIKSPLDYVVKMSMTFEQANIDFSLYYQNIFRQIHDIKSAEILDIIYREEIGHVKYGFDWFKKWENPKPEEEWERYCSLLDFPMTPMRAKGIIFDHEGRKKIGFSEDYINSLKIYSHSKGRLAKIFYYNPSCEEEIGLQGFNYSPSAKAEQFRYDTQCLMGFIASKDDVVLTDHEISPSLLNLWRSVGFAENEFINWNHNSKTIPVSVKKRKFDRIIPWGWSQYIEKRFQPWIKKLKSPPSNYDATLFGKSFAITVLQKFFEHSPITPVYLCSKNKIGRKFTDTHTCLDYAKKMLSQQKHVRVKSNYGASGRNAFKILNTEEIDTKLYNRIENLIQTFGSVILEENLHLIAEFSVILNVDAKNKHHVKGVTRFVTDEHGHYKGHIINDFFYECDKKVIETLYQPKEKSEKFLAYMNKVGEFAGQELLTAGYQGPAGIDGYIYLENGKYFVKPISEINVRHTMGLIALNLQKKITQGNFATWQHKSFNQIQEEGFKNFLDFADHMSLNYPLELKEGQNNLIESGFFPTNDPETSRSVLTFLNVKKRETHPSEFLKSNKKETSTSF